MLNGTSAYRNACDELMTSFPGAVVSRLTFCGIFNKACSEAVTVSSVQSGLHPFNADAIPSEAYLPNTLYASSDVTSSAAPLPLLQQTGPPNGTDNLTQSTSTESLNLMSYRRVMEHLPP